MNDIDTRITQFETMCAADPDNEMAHFSLGNAYIEANRFAEAATAFKKVIDLSPQMSKAYQLAGLAMVECGWSDEAVSTLEHGYQLAASRGDRLVQTAIEEQLKAIGRVPPDISDESKDAAAAMEASGDFLCARTGKSGTQLEGPPFKGPVGEWIYNNIAAETWQAWIGQGTKVINELRLDFSRDEDQETYDREMHEYLGINDDMLTEIRQG